MILSAFSGHLYAETTLAQDSVQQLDTIVVTTEQNTNSQQQTAANSLKFREEPTLFQISSSNISVWEPLLTSSVSSPAFMPNRRAMKEPKFLSVVLALTVLLVHMHPNLCHDR